MQRFFYFFLFVLVSCIPAWQSTAYAGNIGITSARIESSDESYRLAANFNFELSHELEKVISNGIPLYFVTEVEFTRPRWYWFDEKTITNAQNIRISYNIITRQYRASVNGSFAQ